MMDRALHYYITLGLHYSGEVSTHLHSQQGAISVSFPTDLPFLASHILSPLTLYQY